MAATDRSYAVVTEGEPAPDFELTSDSGATVRLADLRGAPVVVFFYPKDGTPGCTRQACGIRDAWGEFQRAGATVLGISLLDEASKARFKEKYALPFTLLADPDHAVAEAYGVWVEKRNYGKTYWGLERSTFVIDANGTVAKVMRRVNPDTHAADVLAVLTGESR
jgi:peroxiredoxin Q/BCP